MSAQRPTAPPIVLTFAGADPTGGAGLQADLLTIGGMGCHALSVVTALTVQDTTGVSAVSPVDADLVRAQADAVLGDMPVAAIKIGVVGSAANAAAIAAIIERHRHVPVVLDPVLASGRGDPLGETGVVAALLEFLVPLATVITPNSVEARLLSGLAADRPLAECARTLVERGAERVLVTGTHEATRSVVNTLYDREGVLRSDRWRRLPGDYHGSGCTLASAIAAAIANGLAIEEAVREGQEFTWHALRSGFRAGRGQAIPDRYFWARSTTTEDGAPDDDDAPTAPPELVVTPGNGDVPHPATDPLCTPGALARVLGHHGDTADEVDAGPPPFPFPTSACPPTAETDPT